MILFGPRSALCPWAGFVFPFSYGGASASFFFLGGGGSVRGREGEERGLSNEQASNYPKAFDVLWPTSKLGVSVFLWNF